MEKMSAEAWIFMLGAWSIIIGATLYSFYKLLTSERQIGESTEDRDE